MSAPAPIFAQPPAPQARLEEVCPVEARDCGAAFGFALERMAGAGDGRPAALVLSAQWMKEWGCPYAQGAAIPSTLLLIRVRNDEQALWAMEEALKSGAVAGALGGIDRASLVATRRIDFAARSARSVGVLLRTRAMDELSAAHLRWRIGGLVSSSHPLDARASGAPRIRAELVRRRDGPPGIWDLEQDHETHRLRLASRLAGDGLVADGRASAAA